jgi:hypothetical protein
MRAARFVAGAPIEARTRIAMALGDRRSASRDAVN